MVEAHVGQDPFLHAALALPCLSLTPGSPEEHRRFLALQDRLAPLFLRAFPDRQAPQTIVVVPSMTLDRAELTKLTGAPHYEERLLCLLMLLRRPRTRVVYITSQPIAPTIIDYYLHLLSGVPVTHARRRLTLLNCHDASPVPLTQKILARPRLMERIREAIGDPCAAHMSCFSTTQLEKTLAVQLDVPLYGCDPTLAHLGTKSGSRAVFRQAGVATPPGFENLRDTQDIAQALAEIRRHHPLVQRAVIKLNDGFSGEGNALFGFDGASRDAPETWIRRELPRRIRFEAPGETWASFERKFAAMGGVVEAFLTGAETRSPSVQCRIDPLGQISVISTHDQVLGGPSGQTFVGCTFPADAVYCREIQDAGVRVADILRQHGVLGRFAIDFVAVRNGAQWESTAIEINIRKGGTTHPYLMLQFLTDGAYDPASGLYHAPTGQPCFYFASDNLQNAAYRGLAPDDLIDIAVYHDLHFHGASQQGVVFHLIGALSEYGKLGTVCIGDSHASAVQLYRQTVSVLDLESRWISAGRDELRVAPAA